MRTEMAVGMALMAAAIVSATAVNHNNDDTILIDGSTADLVYDGHGALSAGASSRLLIDYDNETRSEILDLLFKPNYGASMHLIKVEIGGDGQSTDGTEASHMHYRDDLNCERGYEFWLLQEARARNPQIKTYVLSWAMPYWVGNQTGYYSQDEIDYHIKWLECTKQWNIGNIDYVGNWNERPWGTVEWTVKMQEAMIDAGFTNTKVIIPDGGGMSKDMETGFQTNPEFNKAVYGIGQHYPCDRPDPDIMNVYNKKFWASEDYSTVGDWAGAACWGRSLNWNFIRMNQTSTISWSAIWSVYNPGFPYYGNGLMYAMTPWSGFYEAGQEGTDNGIAIWTNAHTCQFVQLGWKYVPVGQGSGFLPNSNVTGGSYVTMVSPSGKDFTLITEKLEGRCLRCAGQTSTTQNLSFKLGPSLSHITKLQMWKTSLESRFESMGNITVSSDGTFGFTLGKDSIVTVSSWFNGQNKGAIPPVKPDTPFPMTYSDDFDSYPENYEAKYFADNGGSFQIAKNPLGKGMVMKQWVTNENGVNRWGGNVQPISLISNNANWSSFDRSASVAVLLGKGPEVPTPPQFTPPPNYFLWKSSFNGQCLDVRGQQTADGSQVDTWNCVSQNNEYFSFDNTTGHIVEQQTGKCIVASSSTGPGAVCKQHGFEFCLVTCSLDSSLSWKFETDGTIRPSASPADCVQVASQNLDATVFVAPCSTPLNKTMLWTATAAPSPPPKPTPGIPSGGICISVARDWSGGSCLLVDSTGKWVFGSQSGTLSKNPSQEWINLEIKSSNGIATAIIDGTPVPGVSQTIKYSDAGNIMISINSGWNVAYFDNFTMTGSPSKNHL